MVAEDASSVEPDFVKTSVAMGRSTGEEYFAIGVQVGISLCGKNTLYLSIGYVYGPPGQPDPSAFERERNRQSNETMRYLMEASGPSRVYFGDRYSRGGMRGRKPIPPPPERKERLTAYQGRWGELRGNQTSGMAGFAESSIEPDSQLCDLARRAFQHEWTELDQDVREDLLQKRLTGTTKTSPLDMLSERIEKALIQSIKSDFLNSFSWSRRLDPTDIDAELHFFRYSSKDDLIRPATMTFQYKKAGEFIPQQGLHDQILFNESDGSSLEHSSANDSEENSIGDIDPTRDSGHYSL